MATKKMNPKVKAKWVKALRSGQYRQGKNRLRTSNGHFCCLGVLCNIHAQEHPEIASEQKHKMSYMDYVQLPPPAVYRSWAGLNSDNPMITINGKSAPVAEHNDKGVPFKDIAKAIKEQL